MAKASEANGNGTAIRKEPPMIRIQAADLVSYAVNNYYKVIPAGTTAEDLVRPGCLFFDQAHEGDSLRLLTEDRRDLFDVFVLRCWSGGQDVKVLKHEPFEELPSLS